MRLARFVLLAAAVATVMPADAQTRCRCVCPIGFDGRPVRSLCRWVCDPPARPSYRIVPPAAPLLPPPPRWSPPPVRDYTYIPPSRRPPVVDGAPRTARADTGAWSPATGAPASAFIASPGPTRQPPRYDVETLRLTPQQQQVIRLAVGALVLAVLALGIVVIGASIRSWLQVRTMRRARDHVQLSTTEASALKARLDAAAAEAEAFIARQRADAYRKGRFRQP